MTFYIESPAILAPGLTSWSETKNILNGQVPYCESPLEDPIVSSIPGNIQRRCSLSTLLAIHAAEQTQRASKKHTAEFTTVFSSSVGDPEISNKLCISVAAEVPMPSPTLFHNSVHNAPAGYWSIANKSQSHTISIAAGEASFPAALICAYTQLVSQNRPVMVVAYDQPLQGGMSINHNLVQTFVCCILLTPRETNDSLISCELELLGSDITPNDQEQCEILADLTSFFHSVPAAKSLPLLSLLAQPQNMELAIGYTDDLWISLSCHQV
ncbi:MAG: beta-ketoacyl synthase chain length factor [Candidatus Thiodiazotropha sp. (ex Lucinoma aequizonata)]|nr:beta-ketoacyl synthase chain length factor [Candidatus Thiodiazotropha sp. (ex Lucinoma aequizonata)]MCU7902071.1 beta-ketoacyl synthase chain length factor [Candidatus Thiodiazotropha sp. (ex Lucinoma aequizonata)]MCU7913077.1 beta-ketoacyl synthase chain length factor [Candidatus Thiodiazotropha sp. (ex Lucinoma aequizonata)]